MARERVLHLTKKDFVVQTFRVGGNGGQHRDKTSNGVRIIHHPSGARGECRTERSQAANKKLAFRQLTDSSTFRNWLRLEHARAVGDIDTYVERAMRPENLQVEYYDPMENQNAG